MPKRNQPHNEKAKQRIQATKILQRLIDHVMGEVELSTSQVNAAKVLLAKVLPDMKSIEQQSTENVVHYVINANPELEPEDWKAKHAPSGNHNQGHKPH